MPIWMEIIEIAVALVPAIISIGLATHRATQAWAWFVIVLGTASLAVLSLGLLLSRLVTKCSEQLPTCPGGSEASPRVPGLFAECFTCESFHPAGALAAKINSWLITSHVSSAVVCVLGSTVATVRFIVWTKRVLGSRSPD
jgi:hypothetical protein